MFLRDVPFTVSNLPAMRILWSGCNHDVTDIGEVLAATVAPKALSSVPFGRSRTRRSPLFTSKLWSLRGTTWKVRLTVSNGYGGNERSREPSTLNRARNVEVERRTGFLPSKTA